MPSKYTKKRTRGVKGGKGAKSRRLSHETRDSRPSKAPVPEPSDVEEEEETEPSIVTRSDGTWLVAGWMQVDEFSHELGVHIPKDADYQTVAGFVLGLR